MSNTLTDTMKTAKNGIESAKESTIHALGVAKEGMESAKESTMHTFTHVLSMILKGATATSGIITALRQIDRDDGLAWFGLARKKSPLINVAIFGAGAAVGAGIALLFAPSSGADLRSTLMGYSKPEIVAKKIKTKVEDTAKKVEGKVEDAAEAVASGMKGASDEAKSGGGARLS